MKGNEKSYIVRLKVSLLEKEQGWKEFIYISYEEIKELTCDGNYLVEVEDEFKEKIIKEVKNNDLNKLNKSKSKRSYELLMRVCGKNDLNELDFREQMYRKVIESIESEINGLCELKDFVKGLEKEVNILI